MGKAIGSVLLGVAIVGAAFLTGGISLVPSFTLAATGAVVGGGLAITTAGALALGIAASTALSGVLQSTVKPPKVTATTLDRLTASLIPTTDRKTWFGSSAGATDVRYVEPSGENQEYVDYVICAASHRCTSIDQIWFENVLAWTSAGGAQGIYAGYLTIETILEAGPLAYHIVNDGSRWGPAQRMTGCCTIHVRIKRTGEGNKASPLAGGLPSRMTIRGRGMPVYDPRLDSTVPGGSGPMRADDQSTWSFTAPDGTPIGNNLALQTLARFIGWRITNPRDGSQKLAVGAGVAIARLNLVDWSEAATLCDETVTTATTGTQHRYHGGGLIGENDEVTTILNAFMAACNGRLREALGQLSLVIMHNDLALVAADPGLSDDDVLGPYNWNPDPALEQTPNVVRGKFIDPSDTALYQMVDYPEIRIDSPDGTDRVLPLDFGLCQSGAMAQRLAKQALQRKILDRSFSAPFGPRAAKYQVGDVLPFTFSPLSFNRQPMRVKSTPLPLGNGVYNLELAYEHPLIYQWDASDTPAVVGSVPIFYDPRNHPLFLGIDQAGTTADWSGVRDDNGQMPEANATYGAPGDSPVGGRPASAIVFDVDKLKNDIQTVIDQVASDEDGAAASAAAADQSRIASEAALAAANLKAQAAAGSASAASGAADTATAKADAAGSSAAAAHASELAAAGSSSTADTRASASNASAIAAAGSAAAAQTSMRLAAAVGTGTLNSNPTFADWPSGVGTIPAGWGDWTNGTDNVRAPGINGNPYRLAFNAPADRETGVFQGFDCGFVKAVLEVTIEADVSQGAGVLVYALNSAGSVLDQYTIDFASDADNSGWKPAQPSDGTGYYRRTWSKFIDTPIDGNIRQWRIYLFANWVGFAKPRLAKTIFFHSARFRPASDGEIAGKRADVNANTALAQIDSNFKAQASVNGAQATFNQGMLAKFDGTAASGILSKITDNATVAANAVAAVASRSAVLEARVGGRANLVVNGSGEQGMRGVGGNTYGWNGGGSQWGPIFITGIINSATDALIWDPFQVQPNETYTISADSLLFANAGAVWIDIMWQLAGGGTSYSAASARGASDFTESGAGKNALAVQVVAPSNAVSGRARFVWSGVSGLTYLGVRQMQVERGALPWTAYNQSQAALAARLTTSEGVYADHANKLAAYWQVTAVAGNGRAQMTVHADSNGGGGVDITGDLNLTGQVRITGIIRANAFVTNDGVDLLAVRPGTFSFKLGGSDGGRTLNNGDNVGPIPNGGSAWGTFYGHDIQITVSGQYSGGIGGSEPQPFAVAVDLYANGGGGWGYVGNIGFLSTPGQFLPFTLSKTLQAGQWGNAQLAVFFHCTNQSGTIYSPSWAANVINFK